MIDQAEVNAAYEASDAAYRNALVTYKCDELLAKAEAASAAYDSSASAKTAEELSTYQANAQAAWDAYEIAVASARKEGDAAYESIAKGRF